MKCKHCKKETQNPVFCSQSCAATVNNQKYPKRKATNLCAFCGKYLSGQARSGVKKCRDCYVTQNVRKFGEKKLSEFQSTYARHRYQGVRNHAHKVAKLWNLEKKCTICGYDKHVQLCHKKGIGRFSRNTRLAIVNNPDNLIYLCPNHHWELDAGLLQSI